MKDKGFRGMSVMSTLGVVFITLKLCGLIDWSWWWVTLPFWGIFPFIIIIGIFSFLVIIIRQMLK